MELTFEAGLSTVRDISLVTTSDSIGEGAETFLLLIDDISGPATGVGSFITITITDDDSKFYIVYREYMEILASNFTPNWAFKILQNFKLVMNPQVTHAQLLYVKYFNIDCQIARFFAKFTGYTTNNTCMSECPVLCKH